MIHKEKPILPKPPETLEEFESLLVNTVLRRLKFVKWDGSWDPATLMISKRIQRGVSHWADNHFQPITEISYYLSSDQGLYSISSPLLREERNQVTGVSEYHTMYTPKHQPISEEFFVDLVESAQKTLEAIKNRRDVIEATMQYRSNNQPRTPTNHLN